jgi:hypothetical protein
MQLVQPTDGPSVIMIVWPVVVGKFLILEAGVDRVAVELNDRHRKRLRFRKPAEVIADLLMAA